MNRNPQDRSKKPRERAASPPAFEALLRSYHEPPEPAPLTPIWTRLASVLPETLDSANRDEFSRRRARRSWTVWAAGIAASFLIGLATARLGSSEPDRFVLVAAAAAAPASRLYARGAQQHFARAAPWLADLEARLGRGEIPREVGDSAADLLLETRILLEGPAERDTIAGPLLSDLEMALAQVAVLQIGSAPESIAATHSALQRTRMVERLRAAAGWGRGRT